MILAIDASNIRSGGGLTHLIHLLEFATPNEYEISKVIVWASENTLSLLPNKTWLCKKSHLALNKSNNYSFIFQLTLLSKYLRLDKVDVLFVPGGTFLGSFKPVYTMSQNMLPFEKFEANRFKSRKTRLKFTILRYLQSKTFKNAEGIIFLTNYARKKISEVVKFTATTSIISHGTNPKFIQTPKKQREIGTYNLKSPFKLLYVSIVTDYKHQWNIAEAIIRLRKNMVPIELVLVGPSTSDAMNKLQKVINGDPYDCVKYLGEVNYDKIGEIYQDSDGFIFGSTCENQPMILIEAMSSGLPIACSNYGPMPEVLENAGIYFDPTDINSIETSLKAFLNNIDLRIRISNESFQKAKSFSWYESSNQTFSFLTRKFLEKYDY